jgi:two-component system sensor histidine kinase/response regulator
MFEINIMERILVVDDNPKNIQLLGNILSEHNYDVEYAQSGPEAIELIDSEDFDLILMDVMMPELDGYEACKRIKKIDKKSEIPLIFITAKTGNESITHGFECGGVDYISKPFNTAELLARVETHISLKLNKDRLRDMNTMLEMKVKERTKELRESNEKLRSANEELEVLDNAKSEFLSIISHEIRTPLNGIFGILDIIKETANFESVIKKAGDNEFGFELFDALDVSYKRLEDFSLNALNISKLNSKGFQALEIEKIDVGGLISNTLTSFEVDTNAKNLVVYSKIDSDSIYADKHYIEKCIRLLISNAVDHSNENGKVYISGTKDENFYLITIKDEGRGFPAFILKSGLKAFISSEHFDRNPGLDLYLCKLIINAHKGFLSLKNDNGGSVQIKIPIKLNDN